ncbi:unnamed protein product [Gongylonema pulchrum]|uniref:Uncharacterized protein n=1 Tax=Gongylonema pulchrum TaxID=637853 RepID=A0A183DE15_9BILA|nr:unnamed protein product [Gongylonema pulchrum]
MYTDRQTSRNTYVQQQTGYVTVAAVQLSEQRVYQCHKVVVTAYQQHTGNLRNIPDRSGPRPDIDDHSLCVFLTKKEAALCLLNCMESPELLIYLHCFTLVINVAFRTNPRSPPLCDW